MTNKEIVLKFIDEVFNANDLAKLDEYMRDDYMQHSFGVADGKAGFIAFANEFFKKGPFMDVKKVFENEDNEVAVFFECRFADGSHAKVVDIYRLEDGKLAEHWDTPCPLPAGDTTASGRSSF